MDITDGPTPRQDLVLTLVELGQQIERLLDRALSGARGITMSEYRLLGSIAGSDGRPRTRVELSGAVGLTPSGVTRALRPLEKLGFVETSRAERDARQSLATLTDQGRDLLRDADAIVAETVETMPALRVLTDSDVAGLLATLTPLR